jgi:flagellar FliL protein
MAEDKVKGSENEGKKSKNLIIIGIFSFLIAVIIAITVLIVVLRKPTEAQTGGYSSAHGQPVVKKEELGLIFPIEPEIIVNIRSEAGMDHYLKIKIALELQDDPGHSKDQGKLVEEELTKRVPQIRDTVISVLRSKTKDKIDQKEGKDLIRSEIISSINKYLISGQIKNVYFQDFVIQ